MTNVLARVPVQKNSSAWGWEDGRNPIYPSPGEDTKPKKIQKEGPWYSVKGFRYINFQHDSGALPHVQQLSHALNNFEIIMDRPAFDEGRLILLDQGVHQGWDALGKNLG
jgi:hypothetical protein